MRASLFANAICEFIFSQGAQWNHASHEPSTPEARIAYEHFNLAIRDALRNPHHTNPVRHIYEMEQVKWGRAVLADPSEYDAWLSWQGIDPAWAQELVQRQFHRWHSGVYAGVSGQLHSTTDLSRRICSCGALIRNKSNVCQACHNRSLGKEPHPHITIGTHECKWPVDGLSASA